MNRYIFIAPSDFKCTLKEVEPHAKGWTNIEWFNQWYKNKKKIKKLNEDYSRRMLYCKLILHDEL